MSKPQADLLRLGSGENKPAIQAQIDFMHELPNEYRVPVEMCRAIEENLLVVRSYNSGFPRRVDLREAFLSNGLDPDRIMAFINQNLNSSREINQLENESDDYFKTQLSINEAEILVLMLERETPKPFLI